MDSESFNIQSELAAGIQIRRNDPAGIEYFGPERALIDAKILDPAWITGLAGHARQIAKLPDGGFQVVGEGKGNRLTKEHKEFGAFSVSRNKDGTLSVFAFRTHAEYKKEKSIVDAKRESEYLARIEAERLTNKKVTWQRAKEAREQSDFPKRWKDGVVYHLEQAEKLIEGKIVFTDFPDIGLSEGDTLEAKRIVADLKNLLAKATPTIKNKVNTQNNVFFLNDAAFRNMRRL